MSAANEYCSGVTTYSSPEATRNAMDLLFQTMPNHVNILQEKKSIKRKKKKTNQIGCCFSMLGNP
jgi:hypothetical protein